MKLKYIIPALSIASITAIVAPFTTSCGPTNVIDLIYDERMEWYFVARDFSLNETYTFIVNVTNLDTRDNEWCFDISSNQYQGISIDRTNFSIWLNGNKINNTEYEFVYDSVRTDWVTGVECIKPASIKLNDKFIIKCSFDKKYLAPGYDKLYVGFEIDH